MTNDTWWMSAGVGLAWMVGAGALAAFVALSHNLKGRLRVERRSQERATRRATTANAVVDTWHQGGTA